MNFQLKPIVQTLVFGLITINGCTPKQTPMSALQSVSRVPVGISMDRHSGVPSFINLRIKTDLSRGAEVAAQRFFRQHARLYKMKNADQELKVMRTTKSANGTQRVRLQQYHNGIEVMGGQLTVHIDASGTIFTVNGDYLPNISLSTTPKISNAQAVEKAKEIFPNSTVLAVQRKPKLYVYDPDMGTGLARTGNREALAWHFDLAIDNPNTLTAFLVDAHTGNLLQHGPAGVSLTLDGASDHVDVKGDGTKYHIEANRTIWDQSLFYSIAPMLSPVADNAQYKMLVEGGEGVDTGISVNNFETNKAVLMQQAKAVYGHFDKIYKYYDELGGVTGYHGWYGTPNTGNINNVDVFLNYNAAANATNGLVYDQAVYLSKIIAYQIEPMAHEAAHMFQYANGVMIAPAFPVYENRSIGEGLADVFGVLTSKKIALEMRRQIGGPDATFMQKHQLWPDIYRTFRWVGYTYSNLPVYDRQTRLDLIEEEKIDRAHSAADLGAQPYDHNKLYAMLDDWALSMAELRDPVAKPADEAIVTEAMLETFTVPLDQPFQGARRDPKLIAAHTEDWACDVNELSLYPGDSRVYERSRVISHLAYLIHGGTSQGSRGASTTGVGTPKKIPGIGLEAMEKLFFDVQTRGYFHYNPDFTKFARGLIQVAVEDQIAADGKFNVNSAVLDNILHALDAVGIVAPTKQEIAEIFDPTLGGNVDSTIVDPYYAYTDLPMHRYIEARIKRLGTANGTSLGTLLKPSSWAASSAHNGYGPRRVVDGSLDSTLDANGNILNGGLSTAWIAKYQFTPYRFRYDLPASTPLNKIVLVWAVNNPYDHPTNYSVQIAQNLTDANPWVVAKLSDGTPISNQTAYHCYGGYHVKVYDLSGLPQSAKHVQVSVYKTGIIFNPPRLFEVRVYGK